MDQAKETNKVLFVGSERICRQVAYVLAIENYEIVETLTNENYGQYQDYTIYVCEFKRKSKKLITKIWKSKKDIQYLNDICRQIDKEHVANRRRHRKELKSSLKGVLILTRFKLWCFEFLMHIYFVINGMFIIHNAKKCKYNKIKNFKLLRCLRYVKASVLFLYVLKAPINKNIQCSLLETDLYISRYGDARGCCSALIPFGNLLQEGALSEIYNNVYTRIIKLSSLNHSYCLCDISGWCPYYQEKLVNNENLSFTNTCKVPEKITLALDQSCNLACKSCRNKHYVMNDVARLRTRLAAKNLQTSGFLDKTKTLIVAGQGEVFYSPYYRQLIETKLQRDNIVVLSNGTLFNEENWNWIKNKYKEIDIHISVDAASKETYSKLRCGGDFKNLMKNLTMLADLHRYNCFRKFTLSFVVQRGNFHEMIEFIDLGKSLGVDNVVFQRMGHFYSSLTKKEYLQKCLIINDEYLDYELWQVLQDPIFKDPIVDLSGLNRYIVASDIKYGKNKC